MTDQPFYASDAPVTRFSIHPNPLERYLGTASPGVEIALPPSPKYILVIIERTFAKYLEHVEGRAMPFDMTFVRHFNSLQVYWSHRQMFCSESKFDQVSELLDRRPELGDINRSKVSVSN